MQHLVDYNWLSENEGVFAEIAVPGGQCGKITVGAEDNQIYVGTMPVTKGHVLDVYMDGIDKDPMNCLVGDHWAP